MDKTDLHSALIDVGLTENADKLAALARPAIRVRTTPIRRWIDKPLAGSSRLGGQPDLPPEIARPTGLSFIAQINLLQTVAYDTERLLPQQGLLYFFYDAQAQPAGHDPAEKGRWAVIYFDGDFSTLAQRAPQDGQPAFSPCLLDFALDLTMPPAGFKELVGLGIVLSEEQWTQYGQFRERVFGPTVPPGSHRLLGYPTALQSGDMRMRCQLAFHGIKATGSALSDATCQVLADSVEDWLLLLQVDSDGDARMMWGDAGGPGGMLYFWIRRHDLKRRRFDRVWAILEGY